MVFIHPFILRMSSMIAAYAMHHSGMPSLSMLRVDLMDLMDLMDLLVLSSMTAACGMHH